MTFIHPFVESREQIEALLRADSLGFLGLSVDDVPYVVPLSYAYLDGKIIFHCALEGKKLDMLKSNPRVCFTIGQQDGETTRHPRGAQCSADDYSVICYGTARIVEDIEERWRLLNVFHRSFNPGAEEITIDDAAKCYAVEIEIDEMTGKQRKGGKNSYWRYCFGGYQLL